MLKERSRFFQVHIGTNSTPFLLKKEDEQIDCCTIKNISDTDLPLSNTGAICFLDIPEISQLFKKAGFGEIKIEIISRTYKERSQIKEYLVASCKKKIE